MVTQVTVTDGFLTYTVKLNGDVHINIGPATDGEQQAPVKKPVTAPISNTTLWDAAKEWMRSSQGSWMPPDKQYAVAQNICKNIKPLMEDITALMNERRFAEFSPQLTNGRLISPGGIFISALWNASDDPVIVHEINGPLRNLGYRCEKVLLNTGTLIDTWEESTGVLINKGRYSTYRSGKNSIIFDLAQECDQESMEHATPAPGNATLIHWLPRYSLRPNINSALIGPSLLHTDNGAVVLPENEIITQLRRYALELTQRCTNATTRNDIRVECIRKDVDNFLKELKTPSENWQAAIENSPYHALVTLADACVEWLSFYRQENTRRQRTDIETRIARQHASIADTIAALRHNHVLYNVNASYAGRAVDFVPAYRNAPVLKYDIQTPSIGDLWTQDQRLIINTGTVGSGCWNKGEGVLINLGTLGSDAGYNAPGVLINYGTIDAYACRGFTGIVVNAGTIGEPSMYPCNGARIEFDTKKSNRKQSPKLLSGPDVPEKLREYIGRLREDMTSGNLKRYGNNPSTRISRDIARRLPELPTFNLSRFK